MADHSGRIDCHIHYMPSGIGDRLRDHLAGRGALRAMVAAQPAWRDLSVHREFMDRSGVEIAVVLPYASEILSGLGSLGSSLNEATEVYNRSMSRDMASSSGRFLATAVVDPFGGKEAIAQLDRSLSLPGMVAIGLLASYDGVALDDPAFTAIFDVARHHDAAVMIHPSSVPRAWTEALRLDNSVLHSGLGFLLENTLCILRMATKGVFDRYHDVRFMFCQLGGVAPFMCGRWDYHRQQAKRLQKGLGAPLPGWVEKALAEHLSHLWLDTHSQDRHALSLVMAEAGDSCVVLGGDHPYTAFEDGIPYTLQELDALGLPASSRRKIERANAIDLLGERLRNAVGESP